MTIVPKRKVTRFAQLTAGDLFIFCHDKGSCVALVAEDPTANGAKLLLPLGPVFPSAVKGPTVMSDTRAAVVSFEKNYVLRLPSRADGWRDQDPPADQHSILVTDDSVYFRANRDPGEQFQPCYVDVVTGMIHVTSKGLSEEFTRPPGTAAFAIEWELLTAEREPRTILVYPYDRP